MYRRREFVAGGVGAAATLALGAAFWKDVVGERRRRRQGAPAQAHRGLRALRQAQRRRRRGARWLHRPARGARRASACPARGYDWHRASDGSATFPTKRRRLDPGVQLRGAARWRGGHALRPRRPDPGRLPDPGRHHPELRRRPDAVGHVALVRGVRGGPRVGVRPHRPQQGARARRDGRVQARGRGGGPARAARVHDRGPDRRRVLPLHAAAVAVAGRGPAGDGQGRPRRRRGVGRRARPVRPQGRRSGARSRASPSSAAPRASGSTAAPSTCRPPPTRASTPTTRAAAGWRSSTTAWPRATRR